MEINLITTDNTVQRFKTDSKLLLRDLKLEQLLDVISDGDEELRKISSKQLMLPATQKTELLKRHSVLRDAIKHPALFYEIYHSSCQALDKIQTYDDSTKLKYNYIISVPKKILTQVETALAALTYLEDISGRLRRENNFTAEVLLSFCHEFTGYYTEHFLKEVQTFLQSLSVLKKTDAVSVGAHLGKGLKMTDMSLLRILDSESSSEEKKGLLSYVLKSDKCYEIRIENTTIENEVREIIDASLTWILKTVSDFNYTVKHLLEQLKFQFGFYCGALNLYKFLEGRGIKICFPVFAEDSKVLKVSELHDLFLVIKDNSAIANSISYEGVSNYIITGVNQGGKTTFLRSFGTAQLLAQSGYFTPAAQYVCNIYQSIFTHFPEDEDSSLKHGLLEQELLKLHDIITRIAPDSLLLLNETFATTTDYDAAYLAKELLHGIEDSGITCLFVTHNYEFSHSLYRKKHSENVFLRADREESGDRCFRLSEGEPLKTGYALDLYQEVMKEASR
ncbi:hypothetical protein R2R35_11460 [Anaerocolumna sp. AGMB13020]|uniref:MutS-related protein n=1 Tax=Anaerocolumna sp. AGMB13020 TaxID=3081750 RepID=UPI0029559C3A|nr:hypothetical protein [Anaerocolumna sp. AGMB13020]WOO39068.1 hypothetical protein R2R35_11460 [Anaerocolumna sp. AGMB13020]